jgi:hypothetical protein
MIAHLDSGTSHALQDEFDLVETISKGSFGTVYKAVRKGESIILHKMLLVSWPFC